MSIISLSLIDSCWTLHCVFNCGDIYLKTAIENTIYALQIVLSHVARYCHLIASSDHTCYKASGSNCIKKASTNPKYYYKNAGGQINKTSNTNAMKWNTMMTSSDTWQLMSQLRCMCLLHYSKFSVFDSFPYANWLGFKLNGQFTGNQILSIHTRNAKCHTICFGYL